MLGLEENHRQFEEMLVKRDKWEELCCFLGPPNTESWKNIGKPDYKAEVT